MGELITYQVTRCPPDVNNSSALTANPLKTKTSTIRNESSRVNPFRNHRTTPSHAEAVWPRSVTMATTRSQSLKRFRTVGWKQGWFAFLIEGAIETTVLKKESRASGLAAGDALTELRSETAIIFCWFAQTCYLWSPQLMIYSLAETGFVFDVNLFVRG